MINPSSGYIVNWNNKPAKDFPAGDDRFGNEGGIQRVDLLNDELARYPKATLANVLAAANAAATEDVRAAQFWPTLKAMLAKAKSPSARATQLADDRCRSGTTPAAAASTPTSTARSTTPARSILDTAWRKITDAGLCDRLGAGLCRRAARTGSTATTCRPSGQYSGWHQYMDKDLRRLLGRKVAGQVPPDATAATARSRPAPRSCGPRSTPPARR